MKNKIKKSEKLIFLYFILFIIFFFRMFLFFPKIKILFPEPFKEGLSLFLGIMIGVTISLSIKKEEY